MHSEPVSSLSTSLLVGLPIIRAEISNVFQQATFLALALTLALCRVAMLIPRDIQYDPIL